MLIGEQQKVSHRRLLDDRHRAIQARSARHQLTLPARLRDVLDSRREELEQNAAKKLVFLEDLVGVEPLLVTQLAELHRLGYDWHVDADLGGRILHVVGDAVNQQRDVIEQLVGGEYAIRIE